jgi:hypothetical protein
LTALSPHRPAARPDPLAIFLPIQAALYFWKLGLLSAWYDEAAQLLDMRLPMGPMVATSAAGGHPPLYFAVTWVWLHLPLGLTPVVQVRALSVLFALAATVAADRLWGCTMDRASRIWFLALWTTSPYLLLYSRMGRSYSLQLLMGTIAAACILRGRGPILAVVLAITVYVHYVPGAALLATANLWLLHKRRFRDACAIDGAVALALVPWLWRLSSSLSAWRAHQGVYAVTGSTLAEIPVKIAYWALSLVIGETAPDPILVVGGLLVVCAGVLMVLAAQRRPELVWLAGPGAIVGFVGVTRWVSYPFIPARMIFLYPLFLILVVSGARRLRRSGPLILSAMLLVSLSGAWCYFQKTGFRNKAYAMPFAEIAARIQPDAVVLVDSTNSDPFGMEYALGPSRVMLTTDETTAAALARKLADPETRAVWFLRSTHDVSAGQLDNRFEQQLQAAMHETIHGYAPFSPLETRLMRAMGMAHPPRYFQELLEFRR